MERGMLAYIAKWGDTSKRDAHRVTRRCARAKGSGALSEWGDVWSGCEVKGSEVGCKGSEVRWNE
jgi:hypothetical protein